MAAGAVHINCSGSPTFAAADAVCAALDALRGARVVAIRFVYIRGIPASTLAHHPSLRRLEFLDSAMPPLRDLAGYTQLHDLRELVDKELWGVCRDQLHGAQALSQLEVLDVDEMQTAGANATLAALPRLQELSLWASDLRTVPASMASLTRLTRLDLSFSEVAGGWQHLATMQQLESLSVKDCSLSVVPQVFLQLTAMTSLDMGGQPIVGGWQHLSLLPLLRELETDDPAPSISPA